MPTVTGLPHLIIPPARFKNMKRVRPRYYPRSPPPTQEERESYSEKLIDTFSSVLASSQRYSESGVDSIIFKVVTREGLNLSSTKPQVQRLGMSWLNPLNDKTLVVSISPEKTEELKNKIKEYGKTGVLKSYFDNFASFEQITDKNRISNEFSLVPDDKAVKADVRFYSGLSLEEYNKSISYLSRTVGKENILIQKTDGLETPFARIACTGSQARKLAELVPTIKTIEITPTLQATVSSPRTSEEVSFDSAADDLRVVMVIDSGVNHEHPGIRNVLIARKSYVPGSTDTSDLGPSSGQPGHGTSVAGLAAYGVIPSTRRLTPTSKIGVAKIWDGSDSDKSRIEDMLEIIVLEGVKEGIIVECVRN